MTTFINLVFILCLVPFSVFAYPSETPDNPLSNKKKIPITVAISDVGYYPFSYIENGEVRGFSIDILHYVENNSKYEFKFITMPWPRALHFVSIGKADLILALFSTAKREKIYHLIEPTYGQEVIQLFTLVESEIKFNGPLQQLIPYSIGTLREYSYGEAFDKADYLEKLPASTEALLLKLLLGKRIDIAISNAPTFNKLILKENLSAKIKAIEPYITLKPVHMALTKNRKDAHEIKQTLSQLIQLLKTSPYYQELLEKYQMNYK